MTNKRRWSIIWTSLTDDEFIELVKKSKTCKEILSYFGFTNKGANYRTLKERIKYLKINTDHFKKNYEAIRSINIKRKIPLKDILVEGSTYSRSELKRRLIKNEIIKNECSICGLKDTWRGKPIVLVLDHINGISDDNRLKNLRLVCPNCNSQLPTHCGRHNKKKHYYCKECGKEKKTKRSKRCLKCSRKLSREVKDRPSLEQLLKDVEELNYSGTGRKYGVSHNAIRKWIKQYKK